MKTKAKKFSRKLLALFLAVLMAATCFTGVMTSYAASKDIKYYDDDITYNDLAWNILSSEQNATAFLDLADSVLPALKAMEPDLADMVNNLNTSPVTLKWSTTDRNLKIKMAGITLITITIKLGSVDELIETISSAGDALGSSLISIGETFGVNFGSLTKLNLSAMDGMSRSKNTSLEIVRGLFKLFYDNNDAIFGDLLRGSFDLSLFGMDLYGMLGPLFGIEGSDYKTNMVYNVVQSILFKYTEWFTEDEIAGYKADPTTFVYDDVLLDKMTTQLLDKISVLVTYPDGTSSASRRAEIDALMDGGMTYTAAAESLGYDPNLIYSEEYPGNVLLFAYGDDMIRLAKGDSLFSFGYQALGLAWKTVLKDTVNLLHVNYDVERGHGSNFDNQYMYWAQENFEWNTDDVASNYTADKVKAWADAVYADYDAESADEFLGWVKDNFRFDRTVAEDAVGNWRDIDETTLFNKLRYSPLADYYFDMQTGPINLYFMQTGCPNLEAFFEGYSNYDSLVGGINDCLVAAVKDIFVDSDNIYVNEKGDTARPTMDTVNPKGTIDSSTIMNITNTLIGNALKVIQYTADTADQNILNGFYKANGSDAVLSESNLESAMIPLLVACIGQVNLSGYKLEDMIHPEDWDRCLDAEAVAFVALREYLSYVLPNKDYNTLATITDTKITADFNNCILPMCRDAIIYVIEPYVPVTDANGNKWTASTDTIDKTTSIFDLLNSVVCYYADNYTFSDRPGEEAMGVASLLGICDAKGDSLISMDNDLWTNIDLAVNHLMPVIGTLQGTGYGNADSKALIMGDIVDDIFNIADTNATTGLCGVSNFIYRLLTIFSAEPIQTTPVIRTVYDLLKDFINALFGPRYDGQVWVPVPDATSDHPWDDLIQVTTLAGTGSDNVGAVQKLINNFCEFSGAGYNGVATYPDSILSGLTFAVSAVNSFFNFVPSIGESQLKMGTAKFTSPTTQGCANGTGYAGEVTFTNNSTGLNAAYVDGMSDSVEQMSRYYAKVTNVTISGPGTGSVSATTSDLIAPGGTFVVTTNATYVAGDTASSAYTVTFTYDLCDASGNVLYTNLTAKAYQYLTGLKSWRESVYTVWHDYEDGKPYVGYYLDSSLENDSVEKTMTKDGYKAYTTPYFAATSTTKTRLQVGYPGEIVLSNDNPGLVDQLGVRIRSVNFLLDQKSRNVDGVYYYDDATVYNDGTSANVTVGSANAVPIFDKITGDVLRYGKYDLSTDDGTTWDNNSGAGYTEDELNTKISGLDSSLVEHVQTRTHVAYTFADLNANGAIAAYHIDEHTQQYEYIYLKSASGNYAYNPLLQNISVRGPIDGFYYNPELITIKYNTSQYVHFLYYDGVTDVQATDITASMCFYNSTKSANVNLHFIIADTKNASAVSAKSEELQTLMSQYKQEDFIDGANVTATAENAIIDALATTALPITPDTAKALTEEKEFAYVTATSATEYGDPAFTPLTDADYKALTDAAKALLYYNKDNGLYYLDADYSQPAYSKTPLTAAGVSNGKDAAGVPVTAVTAGDGSVSYYIANTVQNAREWDTTTYDYPYLKDTGVQATDGDGNGLYDQIQWSYYNKNGEKVGSTAAGGWVVKAPDTSYQLIDIDEAGRDTRGIYTKQNDKLAYTIEYVQDSIDQSITQSLIDLSLIRNGLNETNFEIVTYNKMVSMAKQIENKYSITTTYDRIEDKVDENGALVYDQNGETIKVTNTYTDEGLPFATYALLLADENVTIKSTSVQSTLSSTQIAEYTRLFNIFMNEVVERGYLGDRLEEEILCASGNAYSALTVAGVSTDAEGNADYTTATVSKGAGAGDAAFGTFNSDGELVNDGDVVYPSDLWNNYTSYLARALSTAQLGNGSYTYKNAANYVASDKDNYKAQATEVYDAKLDLQAAEIALENTNVLTINVPEGCTVTVNGEAYSKPMALTADEYVEIEATVADGYTFSGFQVDGETVTDNPYSFKLTADTTVSALAESAGSSDITVSGKVTIATDTTGTSYTVGVGGINILLNGEVVGTSASDGTFTVTVPAGTTELTFQGASTVDRTVTLSGTADVTDAVVPIVVCDYNRDLKFNTNDIVVYSKALSEYNVYADFTGDGKVNTNDTVLFTKFLNSTITYDALALD